MPMTGYIDKNPPVVSALWCNLTDATKNLFTDVGTVNALNIQSGIAGGLPLSTDMNLSILIANTNTSTVVLTVDTNPAVPVVNPDGTQVALSQLHSGAIVVVKYDGSNFQVISATDSLFATGSSAFPSIAFNAAPSTGFYLAGPNMIGGVTAGALRWTLDQHGSWIMNAPDASVSTSTLQVNGNATANQVAFNIVNTGNLNLTTLGSVNATDASGAQNIFQFACGASPALTNYIGGVVTNRSFTGSVFSATNGPIAAFGLLNAGAAATCNFGLFAAQELRLMLPFGPGAGVWCYSANNGSFSDMTIDRGSFTGTLTGMSSTTTGTVNWIRRGTEVEVFLTSGILGTSNSVNMSLTGIPTVIQPTSQPGIGNQQVPFFGIVDAGVTQMGRVTIGAAGTLNLTLLQSSGAPIQAGNFTASGSKGLAAGASFKFKTQLTF